MKLLLEIQMDDVEGAPAGHARAKEVARLLERARHQVLFSAPLSAGSRNLLRDQIGNRVGIWKVENGKANVPD
jgi:hypothetical protein